MRNIIYIWGLCSLLCVAQALAATESFDEKLNPPETIFVKKDLNGDQREEEISITTFYMKNEVSESMEYQTNVAITDVAEEKVYEVDLPSGAYKSYQIKDVNQDGNFDLVVQIDDREEGYVIAWSGAWFFMLADHAKYKDYQINIYTEPIDWSTALQILKDNKVVYTEFGSGHKLLNPYAPKDLPEIGEDITGDGIANLTVNEWTGGAHCCSFTSVFSLGDDKFKFIQNFKGEHSYGVFEDLNGDGSLEFLANDWAFAYWNTSFSSSPAPRVVFSFREGGYQLDLGLMKKSIEEIDKEYDDLMKRWGGKSECAAEYAWERNGFCIQSHVWGKMLDYIYAGQEQEAWQFLDKQAKGFKKEKQEFINEFKQQLALSYYAKDLPIDLTAYSKQVNLDDEKKDEIKQDMYMKKLMGAVKKYQNKSDDSEKKEQIDIDQTMKNWSGK